MTDDDVPVPNRLPQLADEVTTVDFDSELEQKIIMAAAELKLLFGTSGEEIEGKKDD